jgi:protein CpxP
MKTTPFFSRVFLTAGLVALMGAAAMAQQTPTPPAAPPPAPPAGETAKPAKKTNSLKKMVEKLGLTPVQEAKVKDIFKDAAKKRKTLRENTTLTPDQKKDQGKDIDKATLDAVNAVLTPEQQKKLKEELDAVAVAKKRHKKGDAATPGTGSAPKGI